MTDSAMWPNLPLAEWRPTHDTTPCGHRLVVATSDGAVRETPLRPQAMADFYREYLDVLAGLGIAVKLWPVPVEAEHTVPFTDDRLHASYDPGHATSFSRILLQADRIMKRFQGRFLGKSARRTSSGASWISPYPLQRPARRTTARPISLAGIARPSTAPPAEWA